MLTKHKQSGMTLIGFLVILIIAGFFAYMAMKLAPPYMDFMGVSKAMKQVATEGVNGKMPNEIRRDFMFKLSFQYADQVIQPSDITFKRAENGTNMTVAYDQQVHFIYNIDFLLHFKKSIQLQGNVGYGS
ncbi:MAG TPA: DUF4845 domain-containing protein [Rhodanobacteraceae bacterium]